MNRSFSIRTSHGLLSLDPAAIMAILNVTPDSFVPTSRVSSIDSLLSHAQYAQDHGASILDLGGCSTRPGAEFPSMKEEWARLEPNLRALRSAFPEAVISIDTFRAEIARRSLDMGADIINDISGGTDPQMFPLLAEAKVPYVLTHNTPIGESQNPVSSVIDFLQRQAHHLHQLGVADVIVDPGLGFAKTRQQNLFILEHVADLTIIPCPLLIGISHKSFLSEFLPDPADTNPLSRSQVSAEQEKRCIRLGANILRTHFLQA